MRVTRFRAVLSTVAVVALVLTSVAAPVAGGQQSQTATTTITHDMTAEFRGVSADGSVQTVSVTVPDTLAGSITIDSASASASGASATVTSTGIVDGSDGDGNSETVEVSVRVKGGGYTDLTVSASVTGNYPEKPDGSLSADGSGAQYSVDTSSPLVQAIIEREGGTVKDIANAPTLLVISPPSGAGVSDISLTATRKSDGLSIGVPLKRVGGTPSVAVDASTLSFDQGETKTVTVSSTGSAPLSLSGVSIDGNQSAFTADVVTGPVTPGESRTATVTHIGTGGESAQLVVETNATTETVELVGPPVETDDEPPGDDNESSDDQGDTTEPVVEMQTSGGEEIQNTTISVQNASAGQELSMNVDIEGRNSTIENMSMTTNVSGDVTMSIKSGSSVKKSVPEMNTTGKVPLAFFVINHSISNEQIAQTGMTVRVPRDRIEALEDTEPSEVALYRHGEDNWTETNTTLLGSTETHHRYRVRATGYSEWVTAAKRPSFRITQTSTNVSKIQVGDGVGVSVRINNRGEADGEYTAKLILNNVTVKQRAIEIAAGGTGEINFQRKLSKAGTYEVLVNDVLVDEVQVAGSDGSASSDKETDSAGTGGGNSGPPVLVVGGVVALIVGLGAAGYLVRS